MLATAVREDVSEWGVWQETSSNLSVYVTAIQPTGISHEMYVSSRFPRFMVGFNKSGLIP